MEFDPEIRIIVRPEWLEVRGNAVASGDDATDKQIEDEIIQKFNDGNVWAWCQVEVQANFRGLTASDYLGACSYDNEDDFKTGGYYEDMVAAAVDRLASMVASMQGCEVNRSMKPPANPLVEYEG